MNEALASRVKAQFAESAQLKLDASHAPTAPIARGGAMLAEALRGGGKVLACGNGGSAADAQHFAAELINRFEIERAPLAAGGPAPHSPPPPPIANDHAHQEGVSQQPRGTRAPGGRPPPVPPPGHPR